MLHRSSSNRLLQFHRRTKLDLNRNEIQCSEVKNWAPCLSFVFHCTQVHLYVFRTDSSHFCIQDQNCGPPPELQKDFVEMHFRGKCRFYVVMGFSKLWSSCVGVCVLFMWFYCAGGCMAKSVLLPSYNLFTIPVASSFPPWRCNGKCIKKII